MAEPPRVPDDNDADVRSRRQMCGALAAALAPLVDVDKDQAEEALLFSLVANEGVCTEEEYARLRRGFIDLHVRAACLLTQLQGWTVWDPGGEGSVTISKLGRTMIPDGQPPTPELTARWLGILELAPQERAKLGREDPDEDEEEDEEEDA